MKIVVLLRATHREPASRETLPWLGACDRAALATALALQRDSDSVIAITAGPAEDDVCLETALRAGVRRAVRLWDDEVDNADLRAMCGAMASGLFKVGFDLVLAGQRSADWGTGSLGPALAHFLGVPHVSSVIGVQPDEGALKIEHLREDEIVTLAVKPPALLAVAEGPSRPLPDVAEHPPVQVMNLKDSTLRMPRFSEVALAEPQPVVARRPAVLGDAGSLLLSLKNAGLVR